jgi:galactose mutarotase-like enzyme
MLSIKNQYLVVEVATLGAEVRRVTSRDGQTNYMWSGDKTIWGNVSPVLFPITGTARNNTVKYASQSYHLTRHGFARYSEFQVEAISDSYVTLVLYNNHALPNNMTYPFNLKFSVTYRLVNRELITTYQVDNLSSATAYFSVGAHPAFNCPFDSSHAISDYSIEFPEDECLERHTINSDGLWLSETSLVKLDKHRLHLHPHIFDNDALFFSGFKSKNVSLVEDTRKITLSVDGFPLLGLWSKPGAPYICIEPWCGRGDRVGFEGNINDKDNIINLAKNSSWSNSYTTHFGY